MAKYLLVTENVSLEITRMLVEPEAGDVNRAKMRGERFRESEDYVKKCYVPYLNKYHIEQGELIKIDDDNVLHFSFGSEEDERNDGSILPERFVEQLEGVCLEVPEEDYEKNAEYNALKSSVVNEDRVKNAVEDIYFKNKTEVDGMVCVTSTKALEIWDESVGAEVYGSDGVLLNRNQLENLPVAYVHKADELMANNIELAKRASTEDIEISKNLIKMTRDMNGFYVIDCDDRLRELEMSRTARALEKAREEMEMPRYPKETMLDIEKLENGRYRRKITTIGELASEYVKKYEMGGADMRGESLSKMISTDSTISYRGINGKEMMEINASVTGIDIGKYLSKEILDDVISYAEMEHIDNVKADMEKGINRNVKEGHAME